MSYLAFSDSFEYLRYGSTAIINRFTLTVRNRLKLSESHVYRCQVLTSNFDLRAVRVN